MRNNDEWCRAASIAIDEATVLLASKQDILVGQQMALEDQNASIASSERSLLIYREKENENLLQLNKVKESISCIHSFPTTKPGEELQPTDVMPEPCDIYNCNGGATELGVISSVEPQIHLEQENVFQRSQKLQSLKELNSDYRLHRAQAYDNIRNSHRVFTVVCSRLADEVSVVMFLQ